jgi:hypothetical protein
MPTHVDRQSRKVVLPMIPYTRLALAAAVLLTACASQRPRGPAKVTASVLRAGTQCGGEVTGPSARWISTEGVLRAAMGPGGAFGVQADMPVDFRKEGVLAVYMGQRSTGGYALALHDPEVAIQDHVGTVVVRFEEPPPGGMVTQVITSPCLLLRLPRAELRQVRVVDPAGTLRASANLLAPPPQEDDRRERPARR